MYENTEFVRYSYDGNAAYEAAPQWEQEETSEKQNQTKVVTKVQSAYHVSLFGIIGFAVVVLLSIALLLSYANYTAAAAQMMKYKNKIETLEQENRRLTVAYERSFDMLELESYARGTLCMDKPTPKQSINLTPETTDSAIIYDRARTGESIMDEIMAFFDSVSEYFG